MPDAVRQHAGRGDVADVERDLAARIGDNGAGAAIGSFKLVKVLPDHDHVHVCGEIPYPILNGLDPAQGSSLIEKQQGFGFRQVLFLPSHGEDSAANDGAQEAAVDGQLLFRHHDVDRSDLLVQLFEPEIRPQRDDTGGFVDRPDTGGLIHGRLDRLHFVALIHSKETCGLLP